MLSISDWKNCFRAYDDFIQQHDSFSIYGTGAGADYVTALLRKEGKNIERYFDSYKTSGEKNSLPVCHSSELKHEEKIIIASSFSAEISEYLERNNFSFGKDYIALPTVAKDYELQKFIKVNITQFTAFSTSLSDLNSKNNWSNYLLHLFSSGVLPKNYNQRTEKVASEIADYVDFVDHKFLTPLFQDRAYVYSDTLGPVAGDTIFDVGGFCGDTAMLFQHQTAGEAVIYVFEPVASSFERINRIAERYTNIHAVPFGLWNENCQKMMVVNHERLDIAAVAECSAGDEQVTLMRLDDFCIQNEVPCVNFIKIDVEGGELAVLQGAEETLRKSKPKLAVAAYHDYSDLLEIWAYLQQLSYKDFYFKHYGRAMNDYVLFAG